MLLQLLAESRAQAGVTQVDLAKKLKEDQSWVSKVERGIRRLDLVELALWCQALGIPLSQFVAHYEDRLGMALEQAQAKTHR